MRMSAPVYPEHDGDAGPPCQTTRASNVQVETLGFYLFQAPRWGLSVREGK